jgi:murein peptide amidase A
LTDLPRSRRRTACVRPLAALLAVGAVLTGTAGAAPILGRSSEGRPIAIAKIGYGPHRLLVVGCIHGNECAGVAIVRRLLAGPAPADASIWAIPDLNPDGAASGIRQNAHGVDLNRNFPSGWRAYERLGGLEYAGPRPLSEPESRLAVAFVRRIRPDVTIWFHQHQDLVRAWGPSIPTARRFATLVGLRFRRLEWPSGSATRWQNLTFPGSAAFVVELPAGPVPAARVARYVRAIRILAVEGPRGH